MAKSTNLPAGTALKPATKYLNGKEVLRAYNAISYANWRYGIALNTHITMALGTIGITNHIRIAAIVSGFNHEVGKWLARRGVNYLYVLSHEGNSRLGFGMHSHILTHIPMAGIVKFREWAVQCIDRLTAKDNRTAAPTKKTVYVQHRTFQREDRQVWLQWRWFSYVFKGVNPNIGVQNLTTGKNESFCEVLKLRGWNMGDVNCHKRSGVSENIQSNARKKMCFISAYDVCDDSRLFSGWEFRAYRDRMAFEELRAMNI